MTGWTLVVPVKRVHLAKTRLDDDPAVRSRLALAFARDTLRAVLATASVDRVVLVTSEPEVAGLAADPRITLVADPGGGLNAALVAGIGATGGVGPVALLASDLPQLDPLELDAVLVAALAHPLAVVPDLEGTGTTLLAALAAAGLVPRFGAGSRDAHEAAGHHVLEAGPTVRRDVDTAADLRAAARLGVGPATARVLAPRPVLCRLGR